MAAPRKLSVLFVLFTSLTSIPALAKKAPQYHIAQGQTLLYTPEKAANFAAKMRFNVDEAIPRAVYELSEKVSGNTPEEKAFDYLKRNAGLFLLKSDLSDLEFSATVETPGGYHVRFVQTHEGRMVQGGEILVNLNRRDEVTDVINDYEPIRETEGSAFSSLPLEQAQKAVQKYHRLKMLPEFQKAETTWVVQDHVARLAITMTTQGTEGELGPREVLLDAQNGEILESRDLRHYFKAKANVFDPDPLTRGKGKYGDPGLKDSQDANSPELTRLMSTVEIDVQESGRQYLLSGKYAVSVDVDSPTDGDFRQESPDFTLDRGQAGFEATNTYYHLTESLKYINEKLGFKVMPYQYSGGIRFDAHGADGDDNSFYSHDGHLSFGQGGVDDAEDFYVILHELGHAIHDFITRGRLSQVNGLSEGCGDYWAQSYRRSHGFVKPQDPTYDWAFVWDGHNEFWPGRTTAYGAIYPGGLTGQVHSDGQIWATAMMKIWDELGREITDRIFLEGLAHLGSQSGQVDAAKAVMQADRNLYQGAHLGVISKVFKATGYPI